MICFIIDYAISLVSTFHTVLLHACV